ncbi:MAG TPA: DNA polymerase Y family protein, partial [Acidimicrobiales bacterium]|nr:DNA polymerase Y family protein [Acidimicrobiales bacterium]
RGGARAGRRRGGSRPRAGGGAGQGTRGVAVGEVTRTLVVWCADWPVVAAGLPLDRPVAVLRANRVVACSPAARAEGVELHQRRRDAQSRCPEVVIADHDPAAEARAFEPVAAALEALTPRIEIGYPGLCAFPTRGPSRYHGGDAALAARALGLVSAVLAGRGPARVGVADGPFAAELAARRRPVPAAPAGRGDGRAERSSAGPVVIAPGGSPAFLAPVPVTVLADRGGPVGVELVEVLERLGIRTLGALAALPVAEVVGRFGAEGLLAHRLARGVDERPPRTAPPPREWTVVAEIDPPAARVEAAAFVARGLADDLHARLAGAGSACTRLAIGAESEHGETQERVWRTEGSFTARAIADRVRWQLDGWLQAAHRPTGGLTRLWLAPDEVVAAGGRQLAFGTGGPGAVDAVEAGDRAARALARVQGLLGIEAVRVPEWRGGRGPGERVRLVPVAAEDMSEPRPAARPGWVAGPWPGRVPAPAPAAVHARPLPAEVVDGAGRAVRVGARGEVSDPPVAVAVGEGEGPGRRAARVVAWAGPWPCDERWWDPAARRRRARLQVVTEDGLAYLLVVESGRWAVEATYD